MPIIYIHGVANRDITSFEPIRELLKRYIVDEINPDDPQGVEIISVFWGDVGANFAWKGNSRPTTQLLGQGIASLITSEKQTQLLADIGQDLDNLSGSVSSASLTGLTAGTIPTSTVTSSNIRLKNYKSNELSDLLVTAIQNENVDALKRTWASIAVDEVANDSAIFGSLAACPDLASELSLLERLIGEKYNRIELQNSRLIAQGPGWLQTLKDNVSEAVSRTNQSPGYAISQVIGELRPRLNAFITLFTGDVFTYLGKRGTASEPGEIIQRLLDGLSHAKSIQKKRNYEPIVVLSHSMGGQIVYDVITSFLQQIPIYKDIRIDFWCATASQVGLFEELKLFLCSDPQYNLASSQKVPFPNTNSLGHWWNVWDYNDFLSYTSAPIFEGVNDEAYSSGMSVLGAHSGYLERPSFFRVFAEKLKIARSANWNRS